MHVIELSTFYLFILLTYLFSNNMKYRKLKLYIKEVEYHVLGVIQNIKVADSSPLIKPKQVT